MHGWMKRLAAGAVLVAATVGGASLKADETPKPERRGIRRTGPMDPAKASDPKADAKKADAPKAEAPKAAAAKTDAAKPTQTVVIECESCKSSGGWFGWLRRGRSGSSEMDRSRTLPNGLPRGRAYYNGRYYGNFNNRFYGPQYGYF